MKKRIVSALMAMAMCVSAMPVSVYAGSDTTAELPEFTQKFYDEFLLNPEESEDNRLIDNFIKGYFAKSGEILGVKKNSSGSYEPYYLRDADFTVPGHDDIKCVQYISYGNIVSIMNCFDNPYITQEEFNNLSYNEQFITAGKIFDETGEIVVDMVSTAMYMFPYYVGENGKGYNYKGEEIDIVDRKIVPVYNTIPDDTDILTAETLTGDANEDGDISLADAVLIMQSLSNPDEFALTEQGAINADYNGDGSVSTADALEIQVFCIS